MRAAPMKVPAVWRKDMVISHSVRPGKATGRVCLWIAQTVSTSAVAVTRRRRRMLDVGRTKKEGAGYAGPLRSGERDGRSEGGLDRSPVQPLRGVVVADG